MSAVVSQNKKQLGQFFTTNADYILQGLDKYVHGKDVIDPFAGSGDLLDWAEENGASSAKGFDVDRQLARRGRIQENDSLASPRQYKFVLTNPPYLNVNKADTKTKAKYFSTKEFEDLYQLSLRSIMNSEEGIVIVPINFLSAYNARGIRKLFFSKFEIDRMNYFREQVFPDTTYNVIAFHYKLKSTKSMNAFSINTNIFPEKDDITVELRREFDWTIGGDIYEKLKDQKDVLGIYRLVEEHIRENKGHVSLQGAYNHVKTPHVVYVSLEFAQRIKSNIIFLRAIDGGSEDSLVGLDDIRTHRIACLVSKPTSRHMIHLITERGLSISEQEELIKLFNQELEKMRKKHLSLFLTNYRDKDRKRISFDFVYKLLNYLYEQHIAEPKIKSLLHYEQMGSAKHKSRSRTRVLR